MVDFTQHILVLISITSLGSCLITDEQQARDWLDWYNDRAQEVYYEDVIGAWNYNTNITDYNQQRSVSIPGEPFQ